MGAQPSAGAPGSTTTAGEAQDQRLGQVALARGLIDHRQLAGCLNEQRKASEAGGNIPRLAQLLVKHQLLNAAQLVELLRDSQTAPKKVACPKCGSACQTRANSQQTQCGNCGELVSTAAASGGHAAPPPQTATGPIDSRLRGRSHLGRYKLVREVARGGMGVIYEAVDPDLKRSVALKVLKDADSSADRVRRLHREAAVAARLSHPHIIPIHEVGVAKDERTGKPVHFIAMDYVEGETLADAMEEMDMTTRMRAMEQVSAATGYAHGQGVIHRDLKPANILLNKEGRAIVTDFGLARWEGDNTQLTQSGAVMGTAHYMAPEQVLGKTKEIDAKTDVWALGVMLYEQLTGQRPFEGHTAAEVYQGILRVDPTPPRQITRVNRDLETICLKALEKDRLRRYATGQEVADELVRYREGEPIMARPPSHLYRLRKKIRRHPWFFSGAILIAVLICVAIYWVMYLIERGQTFDQLRAQALTEFAAKQWTKALVTCERALSISGDEKLESLAKTCRLELRKESEDITDQLEKHKKFQALQKEMQPISRKIEETRPFFYIPRVNIPQKIDEMERALLHLEKLTTDGPNAEFNRSQHELWYLLGMGWFYVGRIEGAQKSEDALRRAFKLNPGDGWTNFFLGRIYFERGQALQMLHGSTESSARADAWLKKARAHFDRPALELANWSGGRDVDLSVARAYRAFLAGKPALARKICEDSLGKEQVLGSEEFWHLKGWMSRGAERRQCWSTAIKKRPHYAWILFLRGTEHLRAGNHEEAREDLKQAIWINPRLAGAYHNQAAVRLAAGDPVGAQRAASRTLTLDESLVSVRLIRAAARLKLATPDATGAIDDLDLVLKADPANAKAQLLRGRAHLARGAYTKAIDDFEVARKDVELAVGALRGKGQALFGQGQRAEGLAVLEQAIKRAPRDPQGWLVRARLRYQARDWRPALGDLEQAISIDRNLADAHELRGLILLDGLLEPAGAANALTALITLRPKDGAAWRLRGRARLAARQHAEAVSDYQQALQLDSSDWQAWLGCARGLSAQPDQRDAARAAIKRARETAPAKEQGTIDDLARTLDK